jgi:hypothetical protein
MSRGQSRADRAAKQQYIEQHIPPEFREVAEVLTPYRLECLAEAIRRYRQRIMQESARPAAPKTRQ